VVARGCGRRRRRKRRVGGGLPRFPTLSDAGDKHPEPGMVPLRVPSKENRVLSLLPYLLALPTRAASSNFSMSFTLVEILGLLPILHLSLHVHHIPQFLLPVQASSLFFFYNSLIPNKLERLELD
jgi:hypothetical protein